MYSLLYAMCLSNLVLYVLGAAVMAAHIPDIQEVYDYYEREDEKFTKEKKAVLVLLWPVLALEVLIMSWYNKDVKE